MDDPKQLFEFECESCGSEYSVHTDMEDIVPEFCPFCSEPIEVLDWEDDYEERDE